MAIFKSARDGPNEKRNEHNSCAKRNAKNGLILVHSHPFGREGGALREEGIDIISPHTEPIAMRGYPLLTEFVLTGSFI